MLKNKTKWWILFVTTTATTLFLLDSTLIPVALPTIESAFGFSEGAVLWVVNSYLLALTASLLIGGKICEIYGFRLAFSLGLALFGLGALLAGASPTAFVLLLARAVQGVGSALAFPATAALLVSAFPRAERARALGIDTGIASLFMLLGPLLGGLFTQYLSWRLLFLFQLPFVIFGLIMCHLLVEKGRGKQEKLPYAAALLMILGLVALVFGLMEGNRLGWSNPLVLLLLSCGLLFLFLFVIKSLVSRRPLANFLLFKEPLYFGAASCRFAAYFIVAGTALWVIHFEKILSYAPAQIGIFALIAALPVIALAPIAGIVADKFGFRLPLTLGFVMLFTGLLWLAFLAKSGNLMLYLPGLCLFGISLPFLMAPTLGLGLNSAPDEELGGASGMMMSIRQLASTIGVALMTAVYYAVERGADAAHLPFMAICLLSSLIALIGLVLTLFFVRKAAYEGELS